MSDQGKRTQQNASQAQSPGRRVLRLFIGIPLAAETARDLAAEVNRLQSTRKNPALPENLRWSVPESWHITLQFLGSSREQQFECVAAHLRELHHPPVQIQLGALGTFDRAGVLFVDVRVTPQLLALQQTVTTATQPCGFSAEDRPYHPHITLARRKGRIRGRELHDLESQIGRWPTLTSFTAESFVLYESTPTPEGSRYEILEQFSLGKSG